MILIADSGSTKTDWTLLNVNSIRPAAVVATFQTQGITPIHQSQSDIRQILGQELMSQLSTFPRAELIRSGLLDGSLLSKLSVAFYGSGCTPTHQPMMRQLISEVLSVVDVEVHSDLMAAARALCGREEGIACILGTGANSCLYDGEHITQNTPALGYILGDEGSGSVLGRMFMNAIFKDPRFEAVRDDYLTTNKVTQAGIIERVYRQPMANRYLATTSLYIAEHLDNTLLSEMVISNFQDFFRKNVAPYGRHDLPIGVVGSMAEHYHEQLEEAASREGYHLGRVMKSPMQGLVEYHSA